jgi:hypothetical protein
MFDHSESIGKLAPALLAAQKEIENPKKDSRNPHYGNDFASLDACIQATKATLNKHGIAVVQTFAPSEAGVLRLTTALIHSSGEWISGDATLPLPKPDPQGFGSAATYARRYALQAITGTVGEDDDDAQAASKDDRGDGDDNERPKAKRSAPAKKLSLFGRK